MNVNVDLAILTFWLCVAEGLKCFKCRSNSGNCLEEVCKPHQDACMFEIKEYVGLRPTYMKGGCGTSKYCRRFSSGYKGHLYRTVYCCISNLCLPVKFQNKSSELKNGLECQSCIGSVTECGRNAPLEPCYEQRDKCVQISQRFLPGEELEPIIKGCGNESFTNKTVAYQVGKDFAYVEQKVCSASNCNNKNFPDIPAGAPNRLQCYTCWDKGNSECARDKLQRLTCTGVMDRCMHVMDQGNRSVTLFKGCASESLCRSQQEIYHQLISQDSFAECCRSSLCNRAGSLSGAATLLPAPVAALTLLLARIDWMTPLRWLPAVP